MQQEGGHLYDASMAPPRSPNQRRLPRVAGSIGVSSPSQQGSGGGFIPATCPLMQRSVPAQVHFIRMPLLNIILDEDAMKVNYHLLRDT